MKSQIKKTKEPTSSSQPIQLNLTLRIRPERWEKFARLARHLSLTHNQIASAMIDTNMEGDEGNPFEEIGYHLMFSTIDLYPEHEAELEPLRDAFVDVVEASDALSKIRWAKEGVL